MTYVSNHLSMVEALRPKSNELAAKVGQWILKGGKIFEAEPLRYTPKTIAYTALTPPPKFIKAPEPAKVDEKQALVNKVQGMAKTMTQAEVTAETGRGAQEDERDSKEPQGSRWRRANSGNGVAGPGREEGRQDQGGTARQLSPMFDAPQYAEQFIELARKTLRCRDLRIRAKAVLKDAQGKPIINPKTKAPKVGFCDWVLETAERAA